MAVAPIFWLTFAARKYQFAPLSDGRVRVRRYLARRLVREEIQAVADARHLYAHLLELGYTRF
jgi:hypothetical protein